MRQPNILVFCADELTRNALGCYGADYVKSPNIDALARRGTRFAKHYTTSPLCVPSRGSMITGRYVHQVGCWDNGHPYSGTPKGWAHDLRGAGYRTVSIGKNHFRSVDDDNGFDLELLPMHVRWGIGDIFGMLRKEGATYRNLGAGGAEETQTGGKAPAFGPAMMSATAGPGESNHTDYDRRITRAACDWLRDNDGGGGHRPWAVYVSYVAPHFPLTAPEEFYRLYESMPVPMPYHYGASERPTHPAIQNLMRVWNYDDFFDPETLVKARRAYYALISFLDHNVGQVLRALAGRAEDTLVLFTSDHGEMLGNKGIWSTSAMYEDSVGVPLVVAGPGFDAGIVVETPTSHVDLAPTLVHTGAPNVRNAEWSGDDLAELARQPRNDERVVFSEYHAGGSNTAFYMLRKGRFKYIVYVDYSPELFDLLADPLEGRNLAGDPAYAAVLQQLDVELRKILDPVAVNAAAFAAQAATIEKHGGPDAVRRRGHPGEHSLDRRLGVE